MVATDPFDADFDVCVAAPGYESKCVKSRFDENSNRHRLDIVLTAGSGPTETPTTTITPTQEMPTEVPTLTAIGTALNPNADIDRSGRIDHAYLIEVMNNWFRNVE